MSIVNTNYSQEPAYKVSSAEKTEKSKESSTVKLSTEAQEYLEKLKSKFSNVDFIVADFSSDEEAQKHLDKGKATEMCRCAQRKYQYFRETDR